VAVEHRVPLLLGELAEGDVHIDAQLGLESLHHALCSLAGRSPEKRDGAVAKGELGGGDHQVLIHLEGDAQAVAVRAHALRRVVAEHLGLELGEGDAAVDAGGLLGEELLAVAHHIDDGEAVALGEGHLE